MKVASGFIVPHDRSVREGAMTDFENRWHLYSSPSAAAREIAEQWGVGRTTLTEWLQSEGRWPKATLAQVRQIKALKEENERLRRALAECQKAGKRR